MCEHFVGIPSVCSHDRLGMAGTYCETTLSSPSTPLTSHRQELFAVMCSRLVVALSADTVRHDGAFFLVLGKD
jgi:hypothetical protein